MTHTATFWPPIRTLLRNSVAFAQWSVTLPEYGFSSRVAIVPTTSDFSFRKIAIAAYGPALLFGMVEGAIYPVIALSARDLGASIAEAGIIVALTGLGTLLNNIPASLLTARFGERLAMTVAAVFTIIALLLCVSATSPLLFGVGVFMIGMAQSVFMLARQTYLTDAVPITMRARALSTLGGVMRIGLFVSPFISAVLMKMMGLDGAYWLAVIAASAAGALAFTIPDLESRRRPESGAGGGTPARPTASMRSLLREHRHSFITLGTASMLVSAVRACRQVVIPLWAAHIMLDATTVSVVYGAMGAIDMLLFYPAGKIMDRYGRHWVAFPSMAVMGTALLLMPLTDGFGTFILAAMLLGLGNGIGSGLIMTIGADCSPVDARAQFLGLWRFITDLGTCGGPLAVSFIAAAAGLAASVLTVGAAGYAAAAIYWKWLPRSSSNTLDTRN